VSAAASATTRRLIVAVVLVAVVLALAFEINKLRKPPVGGDPHNTIAQLQTVKTYAYVGARHTTDPVTYTETPPAGGPHDPKWEDCGSYTQPIRNENAVHALEHGAVWVTYDASKVKGDELASLKSQLPKDYIVLSPYEGLDSPIVVSAWNHQLKLDSADDPRISQFLEEYWRSQNAPEPGASCTGGLDAAGKQ
jgi:hypothetical protein